jgi:tetratricopeptide (TPR) repeat protein
VLSAAAALYGLYQWGFGLERSAEFARAHMDAAPPEILERLESGRIFARFPLPTAYAGFLAMALPISVGAALSGRRPARRAVLLWALLALLAANLALTFSAGAMLALALTGAAAVAAGRTRRVTGWLVLAALALALAWGVAAARSEEWRSASPVALRLANWQAALEMWKESPFLGKGFGGYGLEYPRFRRPGMNETLYAHNTYLQHLTEGGLAGAALLGWLLWGWFRKIFRSRGPSALAVEAACLAFLLHNAVDFTFYEPGVAYPFFMLAGMAWRMRETAAPAPDGAPSMPRLERAASAALLGVALLAALFVYGGTRLYEEAEFAYRAGESKRVLRYLDWGERLYPLKAEIPIYRAQIRLHGPAPHASAAQRALRDADHAVALNPRTPFYYAVRGRAHLHLGNRRDALSDFETAHRLYPMKPAYREQWEKLRDGIEARREPSSE